MKPGTWHLAPGTRHLASARAQLPRDPVACWASIFFSASVLTLLLSIAATQSFLALASLLYFIYLLQKTPPIGFPPVKLPLALFCVWTVVSMIWAASPAASGFEIRKLSLFLILLLTVNLVVTAKHLRFLYQAMFVESAVAGIVGIGQFIRRYDLVRVEYPRRIYAHMTVLRIHGFMGHWMNFGGQQMLMFAMLLAYLLFARNTGWRRAKLSGFARSGAEPSSAGFELAEHRSAPARPFDDPHEARNEPRPAAATEGAEPIRSSSNRAEPVRSASNGPEHSEGAQGKLREGAHGKLRQPGEGSWPNLSSRSLRWWWWVPMVLIVISIVLNFTRGIWLGCFIGALYAVARWKALWLWVLPVAAAVFLIAGPRLMRRRAESVLHPLRDPSVAIRLQMWRVGWRMIEAHPVVGVGPDNIPGVYGLYLPHGMVPMVGYHAHLHNDYIQFAAARGLPCLAAWLWFMVALGWGALTLGRRLTPLRWVAYGAMAGWLAFLAEGCFEFNFGTSPVLMVFLFVIATPFAAERIERLGRTAPVVAAPPQNE